MRVTGAEGYREPRDSLAHDWHAFLAAALPGVPWLALPNVGPGVVEYAQSWGVDAVLLTGGDDLGACPVRDETEIALLDFAIGRSLPVAGICRGLQLVQHHAGGALVDCDPSAHVRTVHAVRWAPGAPAPFGLRPPETVNSFHRRAVAADRLAPSLDALAISEDGLVEALRHREHRIVALQWHPERCAATPAWEAAMLRGHFGFQEPGR